MKLTALFVARNGRNFFTSLQEREHSNYQFDFLKHDHSLFPLFMNYVDQYSHMLSPAASTLERITSYAENKLQLLQDSMKRAEYMIYQKEQASNAEKKKLKDKEIFASIDWHDFTVAETLSFTEEDSRLPMPPPMTLKTLLTMTLSQKQQSNQNKLDMLAVGEMILQGRGDSINEVEDMEMDISNENPEYDELIYNKSPETLGEEFMNVEQAAFAKESYVPRALLQKQQKMATEESQLCPRCNKRIPISQMAEHMRLELLDPKWKEQKEAYESKFQNTNLIAGGEEVARNLAEIAKKRSDIFEKSEASPTELSSGVVDTSKKIRWDGSASSVEATKAALQATSHSAQIKEIAVAQAQVQQQLQQQPQPSPKVPMFPTPPIPLSSPPSFPIPPMPFPPGVPGQMMPPHMQFPMPMMIMTPQGPMMVPPGGMPPLFMPSPVPGSFLPMQMPVSQGTSSGMSPPVPAMTVPGYPIPVKQVPLPPSNITSVKIKVPDDLSKEEWSFHGQLLDLPLPSGNLTTIDAVKDMIASALGLPNSRQKLWIEGQSPFKNISTLLELGISQDSVILLGLKERGGKK